MTEQKADESPPADTSRMVARDELVAGLDRAASRKVTIISAPAGSGKTSLLRAWANGLGRGHRIAFVPVHCSRK
jgi:LuxR family maltose regulon positive regulatory protein